MRRTVTVLAVLALCAGGAAALYPGSAGAETGPVVTIVAKPPALTAATAAHFEVSGDAATARMWCRVDSETVDCADGTVDVTVDAGGHRFSVTGYDAADSPGPEVEYQWVVDHTTPAAAIGSYGGASLTAPRIVYFDELVTGITAGNVRLRRAGTATDVPSSRTCRDEANVHVSCASKKVRDVLVTPTYPLVPGQLYRISVVGVTDLVGNVNEPVGRTFRASVREQEDSAAAVPRWRRVYDANASGGSYALSDVRGAKATYRFRGTSVAWYAPMGPGFGTADVYVDGVFKTKANFYSPATGGWVYRPLTGLSDTRHTLTFVVRGEKGSPNATGTAVGLDAFRDSGTTKTTPYLVYRWARRTSAQASAGAYVLEDSAGATYSVTFRGRGFTWVTVLGPQMGRARVTIDGADRGTYDNWAASATYGYVRSFGGLADGVHTVAITVLGQRRAAATGTFVAVDRFGIQV
jgi:hypothetical protein